jgi:hypothetical protein
VRTGGVVHFRLGPRWRPVMADGLVEILVLTKPFTSLAALVWSSQPPQLPLRHLSRLRRHQIPQAIRRIISFRSIHLQYVLRPARLAGGFGSVNTDVCKPTACC